MQKKLILILLPLLILAARPDFKEGVSLYNQGAYWEALRIFAELADEDESLNPQRSASAYMRIRSYHKLGFNQRALMLAREFPNNYKNSSYMDDLQFLTGEIYLGLQDYREAAWNFAMTAANTENKKIRKAAREYTESLVGALCDEGDLQALSTRSIDRTGQFLALLVAERYMQEGMKGPAVDVLFNLRPYIVDGDLRKRAMSLYQEVRAAQVDTLHIAVVLPLTGALSSIGNPILDGIKYSAMSFMDSSSQAVQLHIYDNGGELSESIRIARLVRANPDVIAQIGPLTNENVKGTAAVMAGHSIPIIAPTATENQLTSLSDGVFQFRATRERKAIALAEYAVQTLGLQTFAIIAPSTEYGQQLADNFASRVDEIGGVIQYQGWYVGEPKDLSTVHFNRIREFGLEELYEKMQADSLRLDSLSLGLITEGDSVNVYEEQLKPILRKSRPTHGDSLRVNLSHIDGIFFPIHAGSIPYIASQLAHNNLETHVFGDENWLDKETLRKNARYLPKLTIVSGDKLGFLSVGKDVGEEYLRLFKHKPELYDFLGFDVMSLLLESAEHSTGSGNILWDILMSGPGYEGLVNQVQWGGATKRENSLVFLMDYKDKDFHLAGTYDNLGFFSSDSLKLELPSETE
jgi:hypothetical protein